MQTRWPWLTLAASLLCAPPASALSEFGIEGMGVVSTPADEARATVAPDGRRIVWSRRDRSGGPSAGGWELWQATLRDGRWREPQRLPFDSPHDERDPFFSADGHWLYFVSDRPGGQGGNDLYRVALQADGGFGAPENLGAGVNTGGDERAPTLSLQGTRLLFASDGHGGAGGHDLFVARWNGTAFEHPRALPGVNSADEESDGAWLGDGRALVFARAPRGAEAPMRLLLAQCGAGGYAAAEPVALSFNGEHDTTRGPVVDASRPGELLVSGQAAAPRAGGLDLYRMRAPAATGGNACVEAP